MIFWNADDHDWMSLRGGSSHWASRRDGKRTRSVKVAFLTTSRTCFSVGTVDVQYAPRPPPLGEVHVVVAVPPLSRILQKLS
jgi:hypothetical protein